MLRARPRMSDALASKARCRSSTVPPPSAAALCLSCSMSACTGSNQDRVMPSRRVLIGIAHAAARIVERPAAGARGRAAAAAARLLARHLAVRPAHHAVELAAHGIEPRGDHGAGVARILLQAGKARARRLLAGDQAPPEAVAEADRPDRQEHIERKGDEPLAQMPLGAEGLAQHQPHQEGERDDDGDHQDVVGERHAAGQLCPWLVGVDETPMMKSRMPCQVA